MKPAAWPLPENLPEQLAGRGWRILERVPWYPECARSIFRSVNVNGHRVCASVRSAGTHPRRCAQVGVWKMEVWPEQQYPVRHTYLRQRSRDPLALAAAADQELDRLEAALRLGWKP